MTSKLITFRNLVVACMLCLASASCGDDSEADNLPDGTYPMTFTAAVDGPTATRATTDNTWTGGEAVAIQVGSGNPKKYTVASGGSMTVAGGDTPFYWENKNNITVRAWYPYSNTKPADDALTVKANQSTADKYQASDHLEAADVTVAFRQPAALTFKHRTAKVVVTLQEGTGITDLTDAAVTFVNQKGVEDSGSEVTPIKETKDGVITYTALLVPKQMQNQSFIKVTIGTGASARNYYYTPKNDTDGNLLTGKQHAYNITVNETNLTVTVGTPVTWNGTNNITGDTPTTIEHYTLTITNKNNLKDLVVKGSDGTAISAEGDGSYKIPALASNFSVSYTSSDYMQSLVPTLGLCRMSRDGESKDNTVTYTCRCTDVISDVTLTLAEYVQLADFYYSDGTWSAPFDLRPAAAVSNTSHTVIGIVMKAGRDIYGDWADDCKYKKKNTDIPMSTIRGYVLALYQAKTGRDDGYCGWGSTGTKVDHPDMNREKYTGFYGYKNTNAIIEFNEEKGGDLSIAFPAAYYATTGYEASCPAPVNSSGWFLPSAGQCWYLINERYLINGKKEIIIRPMQDSAKKVSDTSSIVLGESYWSSTELPVLVAGGWWHFAARMMISHLILYESQKGQDNAFGVLPCLAF